MLQSQSGNVRLESVEVVNMIKRNLQIDEKRKRDEIR